METEILKILAIIDVQNDFIEGTLAVPNAQEIIDKINKLVANGDFDLVVVTQDWHPSNHISFASTHKKNIGEAIKYTNNDGNECSTLLWPDHCVANTWGAELSKDLVINHKAVFYYKKGTEDYDIGYSGDNSILDSIIIGSKKTVVDVTLVGIATDYCVYETAVSMCKSLAGLKKVRIRVAANCCASIGTEQVVKEMYEELEPFVIYN